MLPQQADRIFAFDAEVLGNHVHDPFPNQLVVCNAEQRGIVVADRHRLVRQMHFAEAAEKDNQRKDGYKPARISKCCQRVGEEIETGRIDRPFGRGGLGHSFAGTARWKQGQFVK